ncbi:MAG: riboflavin synthase [Niastella sp.]|nr:riboflavin synthase [Niastella sp.]
MFTGIIEALGQVKDIQINNGNTRFWVSSPLSASLSIDQSLSHDGVCLTVEEIKEDMHRVTAIAETLSKTSLNNWKKGDTINLERCLEMNGRLDGHIVQGHIDTVAICNDIIKKNGSLEISFEIPDSFSTLIIEKGSITINGISLTLFNVTATGFTVAIIPYTLQHTNMQGIKPGAQVNIEFDVIGKYVNRIAGFRAK